MPILKTCFTPFAILAISSAAYAANPTTLPAVFGDHMVLQRDLPLPIWGHAEPGATVTISLAGNTRTATADASGAWRATFQPLAASTKPIDLAVTDATGPVVTFHDVLVGDVWIASGQSNMELALKATDHGDVEAKNANEPEIRLFQVKRTPAATPQFTCEGQWGLCSSDSAARFSAVGYYFARKVHDSEHVPIGVIGSHASGTRIESWLSLDAVLTDPSLHDLGDKVKERQADMPALLQNYETVTIPAWQKQHDAWDRDVAPAYHEALAAWNTAADAAKASGDHLPPKPKPAQPEPKKPDPPSDNPRKFGNLFNGMVAPLAPYAIKGVAWYQGESNADEPVLYREMFPGLIADWRRHWNQPGDAGSLTHDFPFVFVQLPNFVSYPNADWPGIREAQAKARTVVPNTAMAVTIDAGGDNDLHPKAKAQVASRLAAVTLRLAYGHQDIASQSPEFASIKIDGSSATVAFDHVADGLELRAGPTTQTSSSDEVAAFAVAGDDGNFVAADARIVGKDTIQVKSQKVSHIVYVRYAWANTPHVNLYNSEGLPAAPFRTDDLRLIAPTTEPTQPN